MAFLDPITPIYELVLTFSPCVPSFFTIQFLLKLQLAQIDRQTDRQTSEFQLVLSSWSFLYISRIQKKDLIFFSKSSRKKFQGDVKRRLWKSELLILIINNNLFVSIIQTGWVFLKVCEGSVNEKISYEEENERTVKRRAVSR